MKKILVVSEAMGQPNHKRGIFHFTRELIGSLAEEGHQLTLLVETTRRYRKLRRRQHWSRLLPANSRLIELLALYRFLDEADMNAPVVRRGLRRTIDWARHKIAAATSVEFGECMLRAFRLLPVRSRRIDNESDGLAYIPTDLRHLRVFRDFLLEPGLYSYQDASALSRLPPPRIDARSHDIIIVDTPTRVAIKRRPGAKVICVVHDLLPLTDLKLSDFATSVFLSRLQTSLLQADELVFVSHYSMLRFAALLPQFARLPARVVYPRTRFDADRRGNTLATASRFARPTFVVIVSNEARKNLTAVMRAFRNLPEADLVVVGRAEHINRKENLSSNIRFAGYVEDQDKTALIAEAHGLIMPSLAEGFGIPIIESLAAGTPVLCSDIPVFREVAGELADYFDPFSTGSICASVARVLSQQERLRSRIAEQHAKLAERFGHRTQARDLLARQVVDSTLPKAEIPAGSPAFLSVTATDQGAAMES